MLDIRKPYMGMTNRIYLKPLNSSRNKDTSTNFKFQIWKCLPNTLWSFRLSTRLGKVSRILFEKAADHRIISMLAELWSAFWSHYEFFTKHDEVFQAFNKIGQGKQNSVQKISWPQNSLNVSRIMRNSDHIVSFYRICCGRSGFQQNCTR